MADLDAAGIVRSERPTRPEVIDHPYYAEERQRQQRLKEDLWTQEHAGYTK